MSKPLARSRRVAGRARVVHVGGEADLVVGDDVERAAGAVPLERAQVERLGHHALAGEGGIAVDGDRQRRGRVVMRVAPAPLGLPGAGPGRPPPAPTNSRWLGLGDRVTVIDLFLPRPVRALGAVVVLHVAGAALGRELARFDVAAALELGEDRLVRPAHGMGQHVEPPAVRHADHHVARAALGRALDRQVEHRHQHVDAFDREPLLAEVGLVQELLERLDLGEPLEQPLLLVRRHRLCGRRRSRSSRGARRAPRGRDVLDLVRHGAAVGRLEVRAATRRASPPGTAMRSTFAGIAAMTSGVRPSGPGSSAGSPMGGVPSGSSCAARWPCMRKALTSAIAAAT